MDVKLLVNSPLSRYGFIGCEAVLVDRKRQRCHVSRESQIHLRVSNPHTEMKQVTFQAFVQKLDCTDAQFWSGEQTFEVDPKSDVCVPLFCNFGKTQSHMRITSEECGFFAFVVVV